MSETQGGKYSVGLMEGITAKKFLTYTLTPQLLPRTQELLFSGFSHIAFFMAQIYRGARLLPSDHSYLNPANIGRFGIRHVIIEAGNNLVMRKENIDQIIVYGVMLVGLVLLMMQLFLLGFSLFAQAAYAFPLPTTFTGYFLVPTATHDLAFVLLDRVFGLNGFFIDSGGGATCVATGAPCFDLGQSTRVMQPDQTLRTQVAGGGGTLDPVTPVAITYPWGAHLALHSLFQTYNTGLLFVAALILAYFVMAVVVETAQSGTAFGRRFNHLWAPLRIVAAIGLLVPLPSTYANGLNSAQYILLYAAKWGSGFATNGWIYFNTEATNSGSTLLGAPSDLVAHPNSPPVNTLVEFFTVVATCKQAYERMYHARPGRPAVNISAWLVNPREATAAIPFTGTNFATALNHFHKGDIIVRFGELRGAEYQANDGGVAPLCGEVMLQVTELDPTGSPGAYQILNNYYDFLRDQLWANAANSWPALCSYSNDVTDVGCIARNVVDRYLPIYNDPNAPLPDSTVLAAMLDDYQFFYVDNIVANGVTAQQGSPEWLESLSQLGWGGAGIWYNKVAQLNGSLIGAAYNLPTVKLYPKIMEDIRRKKASADTSPPSNDRFKLYRSGGISMVLSDEEGLQIAKAMYAAQSLWREHYSVQKQTGGMWIDIMNAIFGTQGLFDIRRNADLGVHPLAQLTAIGRSVIDTAIRNLGFSAAAGLGGGVMNLVSDNFIGKAALMASGILSQIAMVGISIGFVLFYIVPMMPFIYFFFAVGGWIKGIFEAMVGVPLWALAHIRIDGQGLPGDAALGGYFLIVEIFLRPILILFGFLASITIFAAQVRILHEIWPLVASNATGFDKTAMGGYDVNATGGIRFMRGAVDELFFTVMYAIVIYMLGLSAFKMIDLVPNHVMRWMGANVSSFGDQSGDPAQNLIRNSYIGSNMVTGQLKSGLSQGGQALGKGKAALGELFGRSSA